MGLLFDIDGAGGGLFAAAGCGAGLAQDAATRSAVSGKRRFKGFALIAGVLVIAGCAAQTPTTHAARAKPQDNRPPPWPRWQEVRAWPFVHAKPKPSSSHVLGDYTLRVRANPEARAAYEAWSPYSEPLPAGTVLAAFHEQDGKAREVFVMVKEADQWAFQSLSSDGRPTPFNPDLCRRCHEEAPTDFVFGTAPPPVPPKPEPGPATPDPAAPAGE